VFRGWSRRDGGDDSQQKQSWACLPRFVAAKPEPEEIVMLRHKALTAAFGCLLALAIAGATVAQQIDVPGFAGVGARAIGMGGAYVGVADEATGAVWNPAAKTVSGWRRNSQAGSVTATRNLDFDKIKDLVDDLDEADANELAAGQRLLDTAREGLNPLLTTTAYAVYPMGRSALYFNLNAIGRAALQPIDNGDGLLNNVGEGIGVAAQASALANVGLTYSVDAGEGWRCGLGLRGVYMLARNYQYMATLTAPNTLTSADAATNTGELNASTLTGDVGFLYTPEDPTRLGLGLVIRDLTQPTLTDQGTSVRLRHQIDVGLSTRPAAGVVLAADIHDLTGSRTGRSTLHFGAEKVVSRTLTLRAGMYQLPRAQFPGDSMTFVGGLRFQWWRLYLDLATTGTPREFLALQGGFVKLF
jgi:hypothetical protein